MNGLTKKERIHLAPAIKHVEYTEAEFCYSYKDQAAIAGIKLALIKEASIWQRIKWVFTGVEI